MGNCCASPKPDPDDVEDNKEISRRIQFLVDQPI
jgi:hypothetical protein